ncbi:MAG: hypothetical protein IAG13_11780 [Deltaproteobacteria bacterium]|nr:hypothetical protein [Nannocystaceae bacterium]
MLGPLSLVLSTAWASTSVVLAPPAAAPPPATSTSSSRAPVTPERRPYEGTTESSMAQGEVEFVEPTSGTVAASEEQPAPSTITLPDTGAHVPEITKGPEPTPKARPIPRTLTTIQGWYPGEQAIVGNAKGTVTFIPDLQARAAVGGVGEFSLDSQGNDFAEGAQLFGRVRWRPVLTFGKRQNLSLVGMVDVANGRWAPTKSGDPVIQQILDEGNPPQKYGMYIVDPRELYLQWTTKYGQLRVGQMAFNWGQGLLNNDGNNMDRFGDMKFGDDGIGSLNERIVFATKPLARTGGPGKDLIVALAGDLVYRDPQADLTKGDLAGQIILAVRWEPSERPGNWLGVFGAYRKQTSKDDGDTIGGDDELEVGVFDFAGQGFRYIRDEFAVLGAFELVGIAGRTTFANGEFEQHRVLQAGAAVRGYLGNPLRWLLGADLGVASGDGNPDDDEINDFKAAPGFTAGLLMFQYYRGWQSARTEVLARDPDLSGIPPNGTQYIGSRGSVTNALYIQPKARFSFAERFEVWGGPLLAASAVPIVDVYTTKLQGGSPHNSLGGASSRRWMGTELDVGLRARYELENVWMQAGLQGGLLFPGGAFRDGRGDKDRPTFGGWFRAEIRY